MARGWLVAILMSAMLACGPLLAGGSGDVDGDGRFDEQDLALIDAYLAGTVLLADEQIQAADGDGDGRISRADRELLLRRLGELATSRTPGRVEAESASSGAVIDRATGKPLAGVEVALPDEGVSVRTDSEGRFRLPQAAKGKILTVRAANYAPEAVAAPGGDGGFRLALERLSPRLVVLDDSLHHLGDDKFGYGSANYREFHLRAEGPRLERTFYLEGPPEPLQLRVGSLIGLDTAHSVAIGQSALSQFAASRPDGLRIYLNDQPLQKIYFNGDNLTVPLPVARLRRGANVLRLETHPLQLPGEEVDDELARVVRLYGLVNYDDIEFAHLLLIGNSASARRIRVQGQILPTLGP